MMKVAIAGTNGFAQYLAHYLETLTPHQFIILSRRPNSGLAAKGWQVIATNYEAFDNLVYLLTGVDIVISTIAGSAQLSLIEAAAAARVKTFIPSEFRESPRRRSPDDPTDKGRAAAREKLKSYVKQGQMRCTIFTFGIFYERFAPGGLAASQIDVDQLFGKEGEFWVDLRRCRASLPVYGSPVAVHSPQPEPYVCVTSSRDAARFVVSALSLEQWPSELKFCGQRLTLQEVVRICENVRAMPFQIQHYSGSSIRERLQHARSTQNRAQEVQASQLLYLAEGRLDVPDATADRSTGVDCELFEDWLREAWKSVLSSP